MVLCFVGVQMSRERNLNPVSITLSQLVSVFYVDTFKFLLFHHHTRICGTSFFLFDKKYLQIEFFHPWQSKNELLFFYAFFSLNILFTSWYVFLKFSIKYAIITWNEQINWKSPRFHYSTFLFFQENAVWHRTKRKSINLDFKEYSC